MKTTYITSILFVIFCTTFSSCTKDEDPPFIYYHPTSTKITTIFEGEQEMVFDQAVVTREYYEGYTDIIIVATMKNDSRKSLRMEMTEYVTGIEACYYFAYNNGERDFDNTDYDYVFNVDVTRNSPGVVRGNFSGVLSDFDSNSKEVRTGRFDIKY